MKSREFYHCNFPLRQLTPYQRHELLAGSGFFECAEHCAGSGGGVMFLDDVVSKVTMPLTLGCENGTS